MNNIKVVCTKVQATFIDMFLMAIYNIYYYIIRFEVNAVRIVVKVGTSTLAYGTGNLNIKRVEELCKVISDLKNAGNEMILVSSGAIGMGVGKLSMRERPVDLPGKQAAAAVGQCELMYTYDKLFGEYNHTVAQILLTGDVVQNKARYNNFRNTIERLLEMKVLPVVNENDSVSVSEIQIGDNDTLGAIVAGTIKADKLIILTDIDGLYTADPRSNPDATLITEVSEITSEIKSLGGDSVSGQGTGGMMTKLSAAEIAAESGTETIIINGKNPQALYAISEGGEFVGTRFMVKEKEK